MPKTNEIHFKGVSIRGYYIHIEPRAIIIRGRHWDNNIYVETVINNRGDDVDMICGDDLKDCSREFLEFIRDNCPKSRLYAIIRDALDTIIQRR